MCRTEPVSDSFCANWWSDESDAENFISTELGPERHEGLLLAVRRAAADRPARGVDRHLADALREHHRAHHDEQEEEDEERQFRVGAGRGRRVARHAEVAFVRGEERARQTRGDVDHDDQRRAVADAERRDLIGDPHQEERGRRHADDRHQVEAEARIDHDRLARRERQPEGRRVRQRRRDAPRLHDAEDDGEIARDLRELLAAVLAILLQLLERRDHRREQLDDDLRRDVGPDRQEADGALAERAAREHLEPVEETALRVRLEVRDDLAEDRPVHARGRDLRDETAHEDEAERHQNFLAQLRDAERIRETFCH